MFIELHGKRLRMWYMWS